MPTSNKIEEELSLTYLQAVTVKANGSFQRYGQPFDDAGFDAACLLCDTDSRVRIKLEVQLKATAHVKESDEFYSCPIAEDQYTKYYEVARSFGFHFIFLFVLPKGGIDDWVDLGEEELVLKGKMFWASLKGVDAPIPGQGRSVRFYKKNRVNVEGLLELSKRLRSGEDVTYEQ
ncbi:MAG: DUF4365 domain-containing protein [Thermoguttaceae bacterium]|nr:DUF4365 domain-containing protein [Thermoguttaceae bacterium]